MRQGPEVRQTVGLGQTPEPKTHFKSLYAAKSADKGQDGSGEGVGLDALCFKLPAGDITHLLPGRLAGPGTQATTQ